MGRDRTVVVTGASAGIGAATAAVLTRRGVEVVLVGRDGDRLAGVADAIGNSGLPRPACFSSDFAVLDDVRLLASRLAERYDHIDVLLNHAGVYSATRRTTVDGHELTNQVNHLAPFLLTTLLRDLLTARPFSRVVMTGSLLAEGIRPDDLDRTGIRWSGWGAYKASKQANALFAVALAEQAGPSGPVPTCCHPGMIRTGFAAESRMYDLFRKCCPWAFKPQSFGADSLVNLALGDDGVDHPGAFFNEKRLGRIPKRLSDPDLAAVVWKNTEQLLTRGARR